MKWLVAFCVFMAVGGFGCSFEVDPMEQLHTPWGDRIAYDENIIVHYDKNDLVLYTLTIPDQLKDVGVSEAYAKLRAIGTWRHILHCTDHRWSALLKEMKLKDPELPTRTTHEMSAMAVEVARKAGDRKDACILISDGLTDDAGMMTEYLGPAEVSEIYAQSRDAAEKALVWGMIEEAAVALANELAGR